MATPASPIRHQLLPPATLPCSLCFQLMWSLMAVATRQTHSAKTYLSSPRDASALQKSCPHNRWQPEKSLSFERMFFFCPPQNKPKKTNQKTKKIHTNLSNLCLLNISSSQASFKFYWLICVPYDRLINAYFSHLFNMTPSFSRNVSFRT